MHNTIEPGIEQAALILETHFDAFLQREPLGFDWFLFEHVAIDTLALVHRLDDMRREVDSVAPLKVVQWILPLFLLALLFGLFLVLDRQFGRLSQRWQSRIHFDLSRVLTRLARALVLVAGRCLPAALLIFPSYFPIQALFDRAPWSVLFTEMLWLLLAYRACHGLILVAFSGQLLSIPEVHAQRLERFGVWFARATFGFWLALSTIEAFGYRGDVLAVVLFGFKLVMATAPVYLFVMRRSVLALLPAEDGSPLYLAFRQTIERHYNWFLGITIALLFLNAAGFTHAASFILVRGYTILVLVTVSFAIAQRFRRYLHERAEDDDAALLLESLEQLLLLAGAAILGVVVLRLLAIYDALIAMLKIPFLSVGSVAISLFHLLNVVVIVTAAVIATKVLKAILNTKIFPAFNVDIGVAYAFNTLINYALVVIAFFMSLFALGVHLSAVVVVLASLGVGIGFGLQTLTENLISGFIILFGRSVKKGDFITVNSVYGQVEAVGARSVVVRTPDNYDMLIPSKEIVSGQIINWTYRDSVVRVQVPVGVSYKSNPREVEKVLLATAKLHPKILEEPACEVWLTSFGDSAINFSLLIHFDCRHISERRLRGQLNFLIWDALAAAGIEIPFSQHDLHLKSSELGPEGLMAMSKPQDKPEKKPEDKPEDKPADKHEEKIEESLDAGLLGPQVPAQVVDEAADALGEVGPAALDQPDQR
ncbi:MAG: mechanosensitive ion channel [Bradymonadaceae bacterium]|nr:mechanosensitive ion channel [Lujinxingiaceae bacterium]